ncbi:MAG: helix-turn-helix transcriptional regulator [Chloroflexia bacterium]|nr:helix-turn-helix transcriptional regulator [Chloroflexia bacterium]
MSIVERTVGDVLRDWRRRRHFSQLDLALEAQVSARHLSFLETGRSHPSRDLLLRLADSLDVPLRERNAMLLAGGFAPVFPERPLSDPALAAAREAVALVLKGHEPYPALAIDRYWTLLAANQPVERLLTSVPAELLSPPANVLRICFHPDGLAPRILNRATLFPHMIERLQHEIHLTCDPKLETLRDELLSYPAMQSLPPRHVSSQAIVVPFQLQSDIGVVNFITTTTVFGTPVDVTLDELAIESFFPADAETAEHMRLLWQR